jgi:hypothetical protein
MTGIEQVLVCFVESSVGIGRFDFECHNGFVG